MATLTATVTVRNGKFRVETEDKVQFIPFGVVADILRYAKDQEFLWEHYSNDTPTLEVAAGVMQSASRVMERVAQP
jgi:hypothetical protein